MKHFGFAKETKTPEETMKKFESLNLKSETVLNIYKQDLDAEKNCEKFILVLPAGKSAHIEAGIAFGMGKKCYAIGEYEATDSLYNIFEEIFANESELEDFLKKNSKL